MSGSGPLVLGLDVSPKRLGWGLVTLDDGEPVACGCESIDLPSHGWLHQQVQEALYTLSPVYGYRQEHDIALVYIEEPALPPKSGTKGAYNAGRAVQAAVVCAARRWPWAWPDDPKAMEERMLKPAEWRQLAGLPGNASKDAVRLEAINLMHNPYFDDGTDPDPGSQDAADALLIALAGQRRNAEVWDRAVERGGP